MTISDSVRRSRLVAVAGIPVERFLELHDHVDALVSELAVVAEPGTATAPEVEPLLALLEGLDGAFAPAREASRRAARAARRAGAATFELAVELPPAAGPLVDVWNGLLDGADAASSRGLLRTPPAPPDVVDLRRWIGAEITGLLDRT